MKWCWHRFAVKMTSRKFWAAVAGFVAAVMAAFNFENMAIENAITIVGALGLLVAYILGEGLADAKKNESECLNQETEDKALK